MAKLKLYEVSLVVTHIEAEDEGDAIKEFDKMVSVGVFGRDSYVVEEEKE